MRRYVIAITVLLLSGCSSKILHTQIPTDLAAGEAVAGIPYRVPKRFIAEVYEKRTGGYEKIAELPVTIPDPDRIYVLGFQSQTLATSTLDIQMNADNTLQQVGLKSASGAAAALTATGAQLSAVATAEAARQTAAGTAAAAKATAGSAAETAAATAAIAADKAKQAADLAALQYELLRANPAASAEDILKAAQKERSAKLDANEAARLAGKPPYFPDVVP